MNPLPDSTADLPRRSPGALWGTAYLAWGMTVLLAMLYAARQLPVESTPALERLAMLFYGLAMVWTGMCGWRSVERGWRLRQPRQNERASRVETAGELLVAATMLGALVARGQLYVAGLDRWVSVLAVVGIVSTVLAISSSLSSSEGARVDARERRVARLRAALAVLVVAVAAIIELW